MSNPTIKDPEFITPDMDQKMMVRALARIEESKAKDKNKNEYLGELKFRVLGNRVTATSVQRGINEPEPIQELPSLDFKVGFDINHPSVDPFRDPDVDEERAAGRGLVDRGTIEKRNVFFIQNYEMFQALYLATTEEEYEILASFLLRIPHKDTKQPNLNQDSSIVFSFRDPAVLRDPYVILNDEKTDKKAADAAAAVSKLAKPATPTPKTEEANESPSGFTTVPVIM